MHRCPRLSNEDILWLTIDNDYAKGCLYPLAKRAKTATPNKQTTPTEPYMTW
jgi:hypothetical protein